MSLEAHYQQLWNNALEQFNRGKFRFDTLIDDENDTRYGLTLLARPSAEIRETISKVLEEIKASAPHQYYYPVSDMHVTVLSIISCQPGFSLDKIDAGEYTRIIRDAVQSAGSFELSFRGITASPSALMVCGYPVDDTLNTIRKSLRTAFKNSNLHHTIDQRYTLKTAHTTVLRFKKPLLEPRTFINKIQDLSSTAFGSCTVDELELVGNDWYQRKAKVQSMASFRL